MSRYLASEHSIVKSFIWDKPVRHRHAGVQLLLRLVREYSRILERRRTFKPAISKRVRFRWFEGRKIDPAVALLPADRLMEVSVFKICGPTLCGGCSYLERKSLTFSFFTCAVCGAVHLDFIISLSTEAFLQVSGRFIARSGRSSVIYCDNGTDLRRAEVSLKLMDMDLMFTCSSAQIIIWYFNPPGSSWWGGRWERLIRVIKQLLKMTLERAFLMY